MCDRKDDVRPEEDFAAMKGGVRGKYVFRDTRAWHTSSDCVMSQPTSCVGGRL
jgi:hypothetical protein